MAAGRVGGGRELAAAKGVWRDERGLKRHPCRRAREIGGGKVEGRGQREVGREASLGLLGANLFALSLYRTVCHSLSSHNTPDCHSAAGALKAANRGD